ncbi:conserved Plasmodium protein, unknown function [Plasmodium berghei]|uniref:Uncharacterized protein n=2 Tax=Plasmodium berghei TaxID=5821 RepID=A0A509ATN1_PLABA|nr:conserved Plasmodium protein, unknown function [Plasmodium berghei ANKA]CXJ12229.1 conserved Plasmodium protein, unknown function [Plasmodium berghei]SCM26064.1 conserved Plasmodium protein, unknown function [Plasmodium berghei]SCN28259.1 conserved Plasmodium protein, unknown function [Plasmodium berghei]SCO64015.1 conserved Plasmodium protein, unknown function [Plasmodium berghei]VUC58148.1 conserved Plasmodium protein, unknown function [Plasmodium berghei ANKA]|eukprot:XP_034423911.1 conserved Plasmodium protein, unknown function [Plasmodium berghei ANKA]
MEDKKNIRNSNENKMKSQNEHNSTSKRKRANIIENFDIITHMDEFNSNSSSKKKSTCHEEIKKHDIYNEKSEKGIEQYLNENKTNKDTIIKKNNESNNIMENNKHSRNIIASNYDEHGTNHDTHSLKIISDSTHRDTNRESNKYKKVLYDYVNTHSKQILNNTEEKVKNPENVNNNNITNERKNENDDNNSFRWVNALFLNETNDEENRNMEEASKFYGGIKILKVNTDVNSANNNNSKKINTDIKVAEALDIVKLPESNNLDESLNSPNISSLAQNGNTESNRTGESNISEQQVISERENANIADYIYNGKWEYPLSIYQKIIFKSPDHDYKKWICHCNILCVLNLPLNVSDSYLLKSLIDMYYKHKNRDMTLDLLDMFDFEYINTFLEIYSSVDEAPRKYELLASHLGIIKFDILFTTGPSYTKNEMVISNIYSISKKLYKPEEFPIGTLGLIYFKNEKYAKEFWTVFSKVSTIINGKVIQLMPDVNGLKIFIEASVYYLQPDSLFAQINYNELNKLLFSIKNKLPEINKMMKLIKKHFKQESIWNLIFSNVDISFLRFYMENIGKPQEPETELNDPNESNELSEQSDDPNTNIENSIISFSRAEKDERVSVHLFKTTTKDICVIHKVDEMKSKYVCSPSLLVRVYNTHINKFLLDKGYCLIACPYLNLETGKKVADFLNKFYLLDWVYNSKDQTCYYYAFKSILDALAVFKKNFIASPYHYICSLFLKFPFGIVTAVYLNLNPDFNPKAIKTKNPQKLLVLKDDAEKMPKINFDPYSISIMKCLGIQNPQIQQQGSTSNTQNRNIMQNASNSTRKKMCLYHIQQKNKLKILSSTEEFFISADKSLQHALINKIFTYHVGLPNSMNEPIIQFRRSLQCYKCITDIPQIITQTKDEQQNSTPLGNNPPRNLAQSNQNNSNINIRQIRPHVLQQPNANSSNLQTRSAFPSNLNLNMARSTSLNQNNLRQGNMPVTNLNQTSYYHIDSNHPIFQSIALHQGCIHPYYFQLSNIRSQNLQASNNHPQNLQASNSHSQNLQSSNSHLQNLQPTNIHPQNLQLYNSNPQNLQLSSIYLQNIQPSNSHPQNLQLSNNHTQSHQPSNSHPQNLQPSNNHTQSLQPSSIHPQSLQPSSIHPQNLQLFNNHTQSLQPSNIHPQNLQLFNNHTQSLQPSIIHPQNLQLSSIYLQNIQPSNSHPKNLQPSNSQPYNFQLYNSQPYNTHFVNHQTIISQLNNNQNNNTHTITQTPNNIAQIDLQNKHQSRIVPNIERLNFSYTDSLNRSTRENNNSHKKSKMKRKHKDTSKLKHINNNTGISYDSNSQKSISKCSSEKYENINSQSNRLKKSRLNDNSVNKRCDCQEINKKKSVIKNEKQPDKNNNTSKHDESSTNATNS